MTPPLNIHVPAAPKQRDYPETPVGALSYTADSLEWMTLYTDTLGFTVADHEAALQPGDARNPGWVAAAFKQVAEDNAALLEDNKAIRRQLKWQNGLALSSLVAMLLFLAQQLYVRL